MVNWFAATMGGGMIGLAALSLFWINGRIAGVSGIFGDIFLDSSGNDRRWRLMFILGLVLGCVAMRLIVPSSGAVQLQTGWGGMITAGLLVGIGTRMGCGCTSGHGICGIARLSRRSFAATLTFMAFGMATVALLGHTGWMR